jgi:pyruvate,water dikinase
VLPSLRRAQALCAQEILCRVIAEIGWSRVNLGLEARPAVAVRLGRSLPFMVAPSEAPLIESCPGARRISETTLFIAHGGALGAGIDAQGGEDPVARFRIFNLAHAELLVDILDVAPLTRDKVGRILARMDRIVEGFVALFTAHTEECRVLPGLYRDLRTRILSELEGGDHGPQLSAELTRLVQTFEDPRALGEVRTLHGLKRYLHQRGLRLGMRLVDRGRATNRSVDLATASATQAPRVVRCIAYVDFDAAPSEKGFDSGIPPPVAMVVDALAFQLLHGQESPPGMRIFCYGNEVQHFLLYGNHPAFLRIDYASPLRGGMIDLECYGVSKHELSVHPDPSLAAIARILRRLDFDCSVDGTRIHARYDKERAVDLRDLREKAAALFRLIPYLMDVDWVIGSLDLDAEARGRVAEAWAGLFARWGVLPIAELLTADRTGILEAVEEGPAGRRELRWAGVAPYRDRFGQGPRAGQFMGIRPAVEALGLDPCALLEGDPDRPLGQTELERDLLRSLRKAVARGEIAFSDAALVPRSRDLFRREHEAPALAEILDSGDDAILAAARVARLVAPLERMLQFRTTGTVDGHEVQSALLALRGEDVGLFALRDARGTVRLALFARDEVLWRRRDAPSRPWERSASCDASELASLLRVSDLLPAAEPLPEIARAEAGRIREMFAYTNPSRGTPPLPGEQIVAGLRASPGRAVGRTVFGTEGREPADLRGAVLVTPSARPEDNTFLYHCAGIVSTGGGILSHAGLIAVQFHKPSLIVAGRWERQADGSLTLRCRARQYREDHHEIAGRRITVRHGIREPEHQLREGDLVVLDADLAALTVLGQGRDALALHDGLRQLGDAGHRLERSEDPTEVLVLRGRRLRARHQIEKLLARLVDPILARHAVDELLVGEAFSGTATRRAEQSELLEVMFANPSVGSAARDHLSRLTTELGRRYRELYDRAARRIPVAASLFEVLSLRLELLRLRIVLEDAAVAPGSCGFDAQPGVGADIESLARDRLAELRRDAARVARAAADAPRLDPRLRHMLRRLDRLDDVLRTSEEEREPFRRLERRLQRRDDAARWRFAHRRVLGPEDGGFELSSLIGWKAANLAEMERLGGEGPIPPWFVVADRGFQEMLDAPFDRTARGAEDIPEGTGSLRQAIDAILRSNLGDRQKSDRIRGLWNRATMRQDLADEVVAAYRALAERSPAASPDDDPPRPFVSIRSSAREEDAEMAVPAGEFETFLFVRGEEAVLEHLKRAWSALWTERAIHHRAVLGTGPERIGGGVIVQRMVASRVSGVLVTANVAEGEPREMVINAGLGLGEGIVSGTVAADHVVVAKEGDLEVEPPRFHYVTSDKPEQVVFNRRAGVGTVRVGTLSHQRLRPALEYVELCALVRTASRLEEAYGHPLDIEFGIEGPRLWLLQARPVATFSSLWRDAVERHPLAPCCGALRAARQGGTS